MREVKSVTKENRRDRRRQPVLWKSVLTVGEYSFDCIMYNFSLSGARVKLDLPLQKGAETLLDIKSEWQINAKVVWQKDGFIGLSFSQDDTETRVIFGEIADRL
ncbi:PilZ domain-containing protein [Emcibacter sp.]|uniref:PilZ domain-containing protein n=1 Tax=Emcibacter sp. TaxID=1979954 RepID=UPI002AA7FBD1|nr:PilZ domain-containing protein [Emcibacter sp.]